MFLLQDSFDQQSPGQKAPLRRRGLRSDSSSPHKKIYPTLPDATSSPISPGPGAASGDHLDLSYTPESAKFTRPKTGTGSHKTTPKTMHGSPYRSPRGIRPEASNSESDSEQFKNICIGCIATFMLVIFCLFVVKPLFSPKSSLKSTSPEQRSTKAVILESFINEMKVVRGKFPGQDKRLWSVVSAATKRVIKDENPIQPAVLMLVSDTEKTQHVAECVAKHITEAVKTAHNNTKFLSINLRDDLDNTKSPDQLKLELDDRMSSSFGAGNKAGALYNIQALPARTAMLFHSYCDNENAPFRDIVLTFTLKVDTGHMKKFPSEDEAVEGHFYNIWSAELDTDTLSPLLSRVANSVAVVKEEDFNTVIKHCN